MSNWPKPALRRANIMHATPVDPLHRESRLVRIFAGGWADARHAARLLWKSPGFTTVTLLTLMLGIGATTAIFSLVYALMLKPLPFHEPDRIVELYNSAVRHNFPHLRVSIAQYLDYKASAKSYETIALWEQMWRVYGEDGSLERLAGAQASAEIFSLLRVRPVIGGFFTAEQNKPGANVVVLTESFWEARFGRDPGIVGRTIRIDREQVTVVGVVERAFETFDAQVNFVLPISWTPDSERPIMRYSLSFPLLGRLASGVSLGQANAEAKTIEQRYAETAPAQARQFIEGSGITMNVGGVRDERMKPVRATLYLLQAGVAFVLLIGGVNVANLLLARVNARQSEIAIRSALGAGRGAIARQLLTESLLLTGGGAALGIGLAWALLRVINRYTSEMLPQALPVTLDRGVLGFAVALALGVGLFIGLIPILHVLRADLSALINASSRSASAGRGVRSLSSGLVIAQVTIALMLLTGAGLLILAFKNAISVDPGIDIRGVGGIGVNLPPAHRASNEAGQAIRDRLEQAVLEIPGVKAAAFSFSTPFRGSSGVGALTLADDPLPPGAPQPAAFLIAVTPGYLQTMRLRLVEGRFFEPRDAPVGHRLFVVDEAFAKKFFPNRSAIGGRISFFGRPENDADWPEIIGVVKNVPHNGVEERSGNPFVYRFLQGRPAAHGLFFRTERSLGDAFNAVREKIRAVDPALGAYLPTTLESAVDDSFNTRRAVMLLLVAFAALALFLSALGIYGVLAYDVSQRTREIGIRGALGATRGQVVALILKQGLWKGGIGLLLGLLGAWLLSRYMTSLLFEVKPTEPSVYAAVSAVLLAVCVLASYLPARRAAKIDPMVALRNE